VLLTHDRIDLFSPLTVPMAKLAVLVALGMQLFVLLPQQHEGDAFLPQLLVNVGPIWQGAFMDWYSGKLGIQQVLQLVVIDVLRQGPPQGCLLEPEQILGNRTAGNGATLSDLAITDVTVEFKSENFSNFAHG